MNYLANQTKKSKIKIFISKSTKSVVLRKNLYFIQLHMLKTMISCYIKIDPTPKSGTRTDVYGTQSRLLCVTNELQNM